MLEKFINILSRVFEYRKGESAKNYFFDYIEKYRFTRDTQNTRALNSLQNSHIFYQPNTLEENAVEILKKN